MDTVLTLLFRRIPALLKPRGRVFLLRRTLLLLLLPSHLTKFKSSAVKPSTRQTNQRQFCLFASLGFGRSGFWFLALRNTTLTNADFFCSCCSCFGCCCLCFLHPLVLRGAVCPQPKDEGALECCRDPGHQRCPIWYAKPQSNQYKP